MSHWSRLEADRAFTAASRARRRAALAVRLRRLGRTVCGLPVYDEAERRSGARGVREIPIDAITATVEPARARHFDHLFRPASGFTRGRWERLWIAEQRGEILPPISVVQVGEDYAVLDGHHRVSVARARGAITIDAVVDVA